MNVWPSAALRSRVLSIGAWIILAVSGAWGRSNTAIRYFNEGVKYFNAKQYDQAIPKFNDSLAEDPEFAEAYFARGACRYYLKSLDGALIDLNEVLRINPDNLPARSLRATVNYESDRWDDAMNDFNAVLKVDPHEAQSLLGRAVIRLKRNDLAGAARDFRGFLSVRPNDPLAPRVREILASLKHVPEEPSMESEASEAAVPEHHRPHAPSMENLSRMADGLVSSPAVDAYSRQVLRGEQGPAVGDIRRHPGVPRDNEKQDTGPEIVEPQ